MHVQLGSSSEFIENRGVSDLLATIWWYFFVADDVESVSAVDSLASVRFDVANSLAQTSHFIGEGLVPDVVKI